MDKKISRTSEKQVSESQVSEKQEKLAVGEGERRTQPPVKDSRSLALATRDIFHPILNAADWDTFNQLRLVAKGIYETSIQMLYGLSPLMCKAFFKFDINALFTAKPKEIKAPESGQSTEPEIEYTSIEINEIYKNLGITDFEKTQASFSIQIKDDEELHKFCELIQSDNLSPHQKAVLSKIAKIDFPNVKASNITDVNTVLNYFGAQERAGQITNLSFETIVIDTALTLSQFPNLTNLSFRDHIYSTLTLPVLPNLKNLYFVSIDTALTLPQLPNLENLSFGPIYAALTLPQLPKLENLSFGLINAALTLPQLPNLKTLDFATIKAALTLPPFPNLTNLWFNFDINAALTLPQLPNLTDLSFGRIKNTVTMPQFPNLKTASYKGIEPGISLPEQLKKPDAQGSITDSKETQSNLKIGSDTNIKEEPTPPEQLQKPIAQSPVTNSTNLVNLFKFMSFALILLVFISQIIKNLS